MNKRSVMTRGIVPALTLAVLLLSGSCGNGNNGKDTGTQEQETSIPKVTGEILISESDTQMTGYPVTVNDTVIESPPEKVICLSSSLTEIIFELGFGDKLIGRGTYCAYPESVSSLTDYGKPTSPDLDSIGKALPDIVITATSIPNKDIAALSERGITVLYIPSPRSFEEYGRIYRALGMVFEGVIDGEKAGDTAFGRINSEMTSGGISLGRFIYITEGGAVAGGDTFEGSVLSLFGENIAKNAEGYSFDKALLEGDSPDTVVLNSDVPLSDITSDVIFGALDAVKNNRIISVSNSYFESPSGRMTGLINELSAPKVDDDAS